MAVTTPAVEAPVVTASPLLGSMRDLAVLLREYEFEDAQPGEVPLGLGITLVAKGPARVRIRARA